MTVNYYVTAKKSSVVSRTQVGNFTGPSELNLIIDRSNRFEIQMVTPDGLKSLEEVSVSGRIVEMRLFREKNEEKDSLIILTEKLHMAILHYENGKVATRCSGNIADRVGRRSDHGVCLTIHKSGLIGIRIYDGIFKVIQWEVGKDIRPFNVRFDHINIFDCKFLETNENDLRLAYIYEDTTGRHLQIVTLNLIDKEFRPHAAQEYIANDAAIIIPIPSPVGGSVLLGTETIIYKPDAQHETILPASTQLCNQSAFSCYAPIDKTGERFLIAEESGRLMMLLLDIQNGAVTAMRLEYLGRTSIPDSIDYLDNGVVFIGSRLGDSQLIRLSTAPNVDGTFVEVLETYPNIGPIRDMIRVVCDGQPQLVTCSGAFKEGSIRVIRNGIGIEEIASVDLPDVSGLFPIKLQSDLDNYIVISMPNESHVLKMNGGELEDVTLLEMDTDCPTLYAGSFFGENSSVVVQVTEKQVRLMGEGAETQTWSPKNGEAIAKVAANAVHGQVVVAARDTIYYLKCIQKEDLSIEIQQIGERKLKEEIACIDISNKGDDLKMEATFLVAALWNSISVEVILLEDLSKTIIETELPTKILPRSIIATSIEDVHYLLIALGDGTLLYYSWELETMNMGEVKKASIGTRPPSLHRVFSKKKQHLFVCSDRPAIIFSFNKKLIFSNVNVKMVMAVCSIQSPSYMDCLLISDGQTMVFGTIDDIQKIHVRTIPMGESVRRIAHQSASATYAALSTRDEHQYLSDKQICASKTALNTTSSKCKSQRMDMSESSAPNTSVVIFMDQHSFQVLHTHELGPFEEAVSIISASLGTDPTNYYIVGVASIYPDETESKSGRLLVFEVDSVDRTKVRKVQEFQLKGSPFSMAILNKKLLVSVNSSVRLFEWTQDKELRLECSSFNNVTGINMKTMGDNILVSDLMRSMGISTYRNMEGTFEEVARDWNCMWMLSCEFITAESCIGAEMEKNLFTCRVDKSRAVTEEGRYVLQPYGYFYLGDVVNTMIKGTLVNPPGDSVIQYTQPILLGTIDGAIGMVVQIDKKWKKFLNAIEKVIDENVTNCLRIDHANYRQFTQVKKYEPVQEFIDGDLIESLLDMDRSFAVKILENVKNVALEQGLPSEPTEILKIIEDLARIH